MGNLLNLGQKNPAQKSIPRLPKSIGTSNYSNTFTSNTDELVPLEEGKSLADTNDYGFGPERAFNGGRRKSRKNKIRQNKKSRKCVKKK